MTITQLSQVGGIFAVLVFWHFFADWFFQSHKEAVEKYKNRLVRLRHCLVYAALFSPLFRFLGLNTELFWQLLAILFVSHFVIDSFVPIELWSKYLRQAPQFDLVNKNVPTFNIKDNVVIDNIVFKTDADAFKVFASTPLGALLTITMDQFFHCAFLLLISWMIVSN